MIFGDLHLGHALCSVTNFQENLIDRYKNDKDALFVDMGDSCDMIVAQTNDKRFQPDMIDPRYVGCRNPVDRMIDDYCELVSPIKDRMIAMVDSNHHLAIEQRTGTSPTRRIAWNLWGKEADNRMLGYSGFMVTRFNYETNKQDNSRVRSLTWFLSHGVSVPGRTEGGYKTSLGNIALSHDADITCFGHSHQLDGWDRIMLGVDHKAYSIVSRKITRISSGSYLKSVSDDSSSSWAERMMLRPSGLGHMEFSVRFNRYGSETYYVKRMVL